jgi:2-oxoglutarate ferredoxin oxidoreductase subunit delta
MTESQVDAKDSEPRGAGDAGEGAESGAPPEVGVEENAEGASGKAKKHYDIDIFRDWCKACGICAAFCPRKCIDLDEEGAPIIARTEACTGCGWCEVHCPDFAISVRERRHKSAPPGGGEE